jgi:DNA-binding Lrp family transcriptional regulator
MRVPPHELETGAQVVSDEALVNHNYQRTHPINLWFVVAGPDAASVQRTIRRIEEKTGLPLLDLPLLQSFHIDLGFPLTGRGTRQCSDAIASTRREPDVLDRLLLAEIEHGLPLVVRPYRAVAERLGLPEREVLDRLQGLSASGIVKRFGCVVRHRPLGYTSNAMAVWDIPDENVDAVARLFAGNLAVTLCYRRPRRLPDWPFNLFCMIHAKARREAYAVVDEMNLLADTGLLRQAILFSTRCFKQRGAVFSEPQRRAG